MTTTYLVLDESERGLRSTCRGGEEEEGIVRVGGCGGDGELAIWCGDFGDFGVSFVATVAGRYTRRGGPRLSVQGEPLIVLTRGPSTSEGPFFIF